MTKRKQPVPERNPAAVEHVTPERKKELFDTYLREYENANSTGRVIAGPRGFNARVIRKGDGPSHVRASEFVEPGHVVEVPIDRDPNGLQGASTAAWMRLEGMFEPTTEALTEPPEDDTYHGTLGTREVNARRQAAAIADGTAADEVMTIKRGDIQAMIAAAVAQGVEAATAKAAA